MDDHLLSILWLKSPLKWLVTVLSEIVYPIPIDFIPIYQRSDLPNHKHRDLFLSFRCEKTKKSHFLTLSLSKLSLLSFYTSRSLLFQSLIHFFTDTSFFLILYFLSSIPFLWLQLEWFLAVNGCSFIVSVSRYPRFLSIKFEGLSQAL